MITFLKASKNDSIHSSYTGSFIFLLASFLLFRSVKVAAEQSEYARVFIL